MCIADKPIPSQIMDGAGTVWVIDEAVSLEAAHHAIAMARVTGAVGLTEAELTSPTTERVLARVHKLDEEGQRVRPQ